MDTTTAATQAQVTVATVRTWCRRGAVAARKVAGRWDIEATSLITRIRIGNRHLAGKSIRIEKLIRRAAQIAWNFKPYATYVGGTRVGTYAARDEAELAAARWTPPAPYVASKATTEALAPAPHGWSKYSRRDTFVHSEMEALTGFASHAKGHDCHYCGLDSRYCDCR